MRTRTRSVEKTEPLMASFAKLGTRLRSVPNGGGHADSLVSSIEGEILPRLMLAHREGIDAPVAEAEGDTELRPEDCERFVDILLTHSAASVSGFVDQLIARGVPLEVIFMELLANAAQRLGELWEQDRCTFADVTVGLCRLHEVLRHNSVVGDVAFRRRTPLGRSILLATACGDQHVFGLLMVAEFFRRDGWRVWSEPGARIEDLSDLVAQEPFDLIGLSVAHLDSVDDLQSEIETLRAASLNANLKVMVGGHLFLKEPGLARQVGADGSAKDAVGAPDAGHKILAESATGC